MVAEMYARTHGYLTLAEMIDLVERFVFMEKRVRVHIRIESDKDLQLLGRAYDYITQHSKYATN